MKSNRLFAQQAEPAQEKAPKRSAPETSLFLPAGYTDRYDNQPYLDLPSDIVYQPHVYELALRCARLSGAKKIIDIGCGSCEKLSAVADAFQIVGIDNEAGIALARERLPQGRFRALDLEQGLPGVSPHLFDDAVVICADVIEHLVSPEPLAAALAEAAQRARFVVISTPDRERARGLGDLGPPANAAHVREWTAGEFRRFLTHTGFPANTAVGYTVNNDVNMAKATIIALAGRDAGPTAKPAPARAAAVVHTYNEADIIEETIGHLISEGVQPVIVDNWSTDGTFEKVEALRAAGHNIALRRFPDEPTDQYLWASQLALTEELALDLDADWILHYDADEIRTSPWRGVRLAEALSFVEACGYNAIDFTVIEFRFQTSRPDPSAPFEKQMTHFEFALRPGCFRQIKVWRQGGARVALARNAGHAAEFEGRKVFPLKFLNKHYPLRGRVHGARKVHRDRLPRFKFERERSGWHSHYDQFADTPELEGWQRQDLVAWNPHLFETEYFVERLTGIGLMD